jgi:hypothetical protein
LGVLLTPFRDDRANWPEHFKIRNPAAGSIFSATGLNDELALPNGTNSHKCQLQLL